MTELFEQLGALLREKLNIESDSDSVAASDFTSVDEANFVSSSVEPESYPETSTTLLADGSNSLARTDPLSTVAADRTKFVHTVFTDLEMPIPASVRSERVPCSFEPQSWPPPSSVTRRRLPLSVKTEPRCNGDIIFGPSHHFHAKHLLPISNDAANTTVGDVPLINTSPYDPGPLASLPSTIETKHLRCFSFVYHTVVDNVGDLIFKGVIEPLPKEIDVTVANLLSVGRFSGCGTRETSIFAKYRSLSYGRHMFVEMPTPCLHLAPAVFMTFSILTDPHGVRYLNVVFSYLTAHYMNSGKVPLLQCDKTWNSCDILEQFSLVLVVGMKYEPFLNFFLEFINTTYSVGDYDSATGSVPPGPTFGEDDFRFGHAKWLKILILRLRPTCIPNGQHFPTSVGIFTHEYVHRLSILQIQVIPLVSVVNTDLFYIDLTILRVIVDYLQHIELGPEQTVSVQSLLEDLVAVGGNVIYRLNKCYAAQLFHGNSTGTRTPYSKLQAEFRNKGNLLADKHELEHQPQIAKLFAMLNKIERNMLLHKSHCAVLIDEPAALSSTSQEFLECLLFQSWKSSPELDAAAIFIGHLDKFPKVMHSKEESFDILLAQNLLPLIFYYDHHLLVDHHLSLVGVTRFLKLSAVSLEFMLLDSSRLLARHILPAQSNNWDPSGDCDFSHIKASSQFQQWDPGGVIFLNGMVYLNGEITWADEIEFWWLVSNTTLRTRLISKGGVMIRGLDPIMGFLYQLNKRVSLSPKLVRAERMSTIKSSSISQAIPHRQYLEASKFPLCYFLTCQRVPCSYSSLASMHTHGVGSLNLGK